MQCPKCEAEVPPKRKICPRCKTRLKATEPAATLKQAGPPVWQVAAADGDTADLVTENVRLARELVEAHRREAATSAVLRTISTSAADLEGVCTAMATSAARLCDAHDVAIHRLDGNALRLIAHHGPIPGTATMPLIRGMVAARAVIDQRTVHVDDLQTEANEYPEGSDRARRVGLRTVLTVPLMRGKKPVGGITMRRMEVRPFTDRQIELLKVFADQAVIAIENARLFEAEQARTRELAELLERQTATANVLKVISRSAFDLQPVLDALTEAAARLCEADTAGLAIVKEGSGDYRYATAHGFSTDEGEYFKSASFAPGRGSIVGRTLVEGKVVHVHDVEVDPEFTMWEARRKVGGGRTVLGVPLVREGTPIGVINLSRRSVRPFTDKQIELVTTFADQAVIAIENTRLFEAERARTNELRESLQQQTATADVLKVISRSAFDLQAVLDALVQSAAQLCEADIANIRRRDGDAYPIAATYGLTPQQREHLERYSTKPDRGSIFGRVLVEGRTVHIPDVLADPEFNRPEAPRAIGVRAGVGVPLVREGLVIGTLMVLRREPRAFSPKQIELLETFADQAVIAIENTRLFEAEQTRTRELQESLEYQTATSEVLNVISRSPTKVQPVFDTIVASAAELCHASRSNIQLYDGRQLHVVATHNFSPEANALFRQMYPMAPNRTQLSGRAVLSGSVVHVPDVLLDPDYSQDMARTGNLRAVLSVPMLRDGAPIGVITVSQSQPTPFSERQIELLKTFADQAVIAIENTRLFEAEQARTKELTEALEQQTATAEVLGAISRSKFELQPVLDTLVASAAHLCGAPMVAIHVQRDDTLPGRARHGFSPDMVEALAKTDQVMGRGSLAGRTLIEGRPVHIPDVEADAEYAFRDFTRITGARSMLGVPLLLDDKPVGLLSLYRTRVAPFTPRQVELMATFADQAVIAIENARLFEEVQARTRELQEALEYQTATSKVLDVISRSPNELQPVLDTIVEVSQKLCETDRATIWLLRGNEYRLAASSGLDGTTIKYFVENPSPPDRGSVVGRVALENRTIHVPSVMDDAELKLPKGQPTRRPATMLGVPLQRSSHPIGVIGLARLTVSPYAEKQIKLIETFADQAVIAIENTRLFEEVQARTRELIESLEQQTATSGVLSVISSSPTDVQPVLDAIVKTATTLCASHDAVVLLRDGDDLRIAAHHGPMAIDFERVPIGPDWVAGSTILGKVPVHVHDLAAEGADFPLGRQFARRLNQRTVLGLPLLREGQAIGCLFLRRTEVLPFTEKQIALLQTFADQAVIAIENARLFEAVQARTRELSVALERQTAMSEILGIIGASPGKLEPVFDAILKRARELCAAKFGHLLLFDGETWRPAALHNVPGAYAEFWHSTPAVGFPGTLLWHLQETKQPFQLDDSRLGEAYRARIPLAVATVELGGARTLLGVPLIKDGQVIGALVLYRTEVQPFDAQQIALLSSFAAQAVIAIENARLLADLQERQRELARSVDELKSLGEVSQAINSSLELDKVLPTILEHACAMSYANGGTIYAFDKASGEFHLAAGHNMTEEHIARVRAQPIRLGDVVVGECAQRREAVQIADLDTAKSSPLLDMLLRAGVRAVLSVPLQHQGEVIGALVVRRNHPGAFSPEIIRLLEAFAAQSAVAVHNARLFKEVEEKGRQLAIASQHKSQFVANMSHELRTPLAAILGYAELLKEGIYGALPEKSTPIVGRIQSNGTHLLGLINTVLDLSKIEAGQFSLNMSEYALDSMVENVRVATESLAQAKNLAFKTDVAHHLPFGLGDEQRLTQVLLNLVGNAIKFTDVGEVRVAAGLKAGRFAVAVTDTGPGIPAEEQLKIFEEFHQVDSSNTKKKGGTGLGLAIARQIVEMHGGRIWVESSLGKGSTFRMELPVRAVATAKGAS